MLSAQGATVIDHAVLDAQWRYLRSHHHKVEARHVAIVGVDERTLGRIDPQAGESTWHTAYSQLLQGMQIAHAAVIGFTPDLPHMDARVVRGQGRGDEREFRLPGTAVGTALLPDSDGFVRGFALSSGSLETEMGRSLDLTLGDGLIDYSRGRAFDYVPLYQVLEWVEESRDEALDKKFRGRAVLVGMIFEDTHRAPTPLGLAAWQPQGRSSPKVMVHGQVLRTLLGERPVGRVSFSREALGVLLAAALVWLRRWWAAGLAAVVLVCGAVAAATILLGQGIWWPVGAFGLTACLSIALTLTRSEET
jgi:CHASE2 domain-containing sensor protein